MKLYKITLTLSILGILILFPLTQTKQINNGTIESIQFSKNKITIQLENNPTELILFDTSFTTLKKGDTIYFQGRRDTYKNKEQIIVDKLTCST